MTARVLASGNLFDFFHERVEQARAEHPVRISNDTTLYLTSLLVDRARTDRPAPPEETLAELHARAAHAAPAEQARAYRELGDRALYLLGYFTESLGRKTVGAGYYAEMGAAAYDRVDFVFKKWFANAFGPVFHELAKEFDPCVALLAQVRRSPDLSTDDVLQLYQAWLQTGSKEAADRLFELGVILPGGNAES